MKNKALKIGQQLTVKEDFKINTIISDKDITIKEGDKGFINSEGFLNLVTGKGKGKIVKINDVKVKGYNHENIARMILNRLNNVFGLYEYLEDDYNTEDFIEEIEDVLMKIL